MNDILNIDTVYDYNHMLGMDTVNPLVTVVDYSSVDKMNYIHKSYGVYAVFLRDNFIGEVHYGMDKYDYQENGLIFIAPGQAAGVHDVADTPLKGWAMLFHPDLIRNTPLESRMKEYMFFSYSVNKALQLWRKERHLIINLLIMIRKELAHDIDRNSKHIIASFIEVLLNYCLRFYDRQFAGRTPVTTNILGRFEHLLDDYYTTGKARREGILTTAYCAQKLHISPNYFGTLMKNTTGKTVKEHIQIRVVEQTKHLIANTDKTISEVAYELGFSYPHHLSRIFKRITGYSPNEYREGIKTLIRIT